MKTPSELTDERKNTHGDWLEQASLGVMLDVSAQTSKNYHNLQPYQRKAIDMILVKISRILTGDPDTLDHWDDIAGYAHLGKGGHAQTVVVPQAPFDWNKKKDSEA